MMAHLLGNGLISNRQYGFIAGRLTSLRLFHMLGVTAKGTGPHRARVVGVAPAADGDSVSQ